MDYFSHALTLKNIHTVTKRTEFFEVRKWLHKIQPEKVFLQFCLIFVISNRFEGKFSLHFLIT